MLVEFMSSTLDILWYTFTLHIACALCVCIAVAVVHYCQEDNIFCNVNACMLVSFEHSVFQVLLVIAS